MKRRVLTSVVLALVTVCASFLAACYRPEQTPSDGSASSNESPAASPKTEFEEKLDWVRKGQYTYIWVFSRKDGKPIDKEDAAYLRENAPQVVDWVLTDDGTKAIAGTNFNLAEGNLPLLQKRFNAEDYSAR